MNYVIRILYYSSLFFGLFSFLEIKPEIQKPHDSPYLSSEKVEHWILIHGTFARALPWYKKGGSGYEALSQALAHSKERKFTIRPFLWSSYNNHPARIKAAQELVELLQQISVNKYHTIHIVAHSHGGTVALLAADLLASSSQQSAEQPLLKIHELFALGMPVHADWYPQAWDSIETTYHLFSYGDFVQPVFTMFERMLPEHPNVYNLPVKKNNEGLWHETLRSAEILMQLPTLHTLFLEKDTYCLHLDTKTQDTPFFTVSRYSTEEKEKDRAIDQAYIKQILNLYAETRKFKSDSFAPKTTA
jgi:pimeloyl-ACP methyl ester carboxylesterase